MTTNKTFLILLLAGVSYTAYNAVAVSENFEISTAIDHEIVLANFRSSNIDDITKTGDIDLGTIVINPGHSAYSSWGYDESGTIRYYNKGAIVSASNALPGYFIASTSHYGTCSSYSMPCGDLMVVTSDGTNALHYMFGGGYDNYCIFFITYTGSGDLFKVFPSSCEITARSKIASGSYSETITIHKFAGEAIEI
ncbi:MAG: hypothetical protein IJ689_06380 [Alphaproteobacteria bacterium]|nr:hypothetical protein [Alphaproteobacteria bacterium]